MQINEVDTNKRISERDFALKRVRLESFPQVLIIHTTDTCNLRCIGCHYGLHTAPPIAMSDEAYQRIMDVFPYLTTVMITGAEMFYDAGNPKGYVQKIFDEGIKHPGLRFVGVTNGTLLSDDRARMVVDRFEKIGVSIDSPDPEIYKTIRVGGNLNQVVRNVKKISGLKKQFGRETADSPGIYLNFIIMDRTYQSLLDMIDLAHEVGAMVVTLQAPWDGTYLNETILQDRRRTVDFISLRKEADLKAKGLGIRIQDRTRNSIIKNMPDLKESLEVPEEVIVDQWPDCCKLPWTELYIADTGDVTVCCTSPTLLGNVNQNSIFEIWNSPEAMALRGRLLSGYYAKDCQINCCRGYVLPQVKKQPLFPRLSQYLMGKITS